MKKVLYILFASFVCTLSTVATDEFTGCKWAKGTAPWAGTYLLVAEETESCLNGSLSGDPTTGALQTNGNYKGSSIFDGEIETDDKAMSFTIEAMDGGYSIKSASGWYIGGVAGKNGITTSQTPLLNTIADDGTITSEDHILSLSLGKIMYRDAATEKVVPYVLTLDTTTEPADYTKATYTIAIDQAAQTASVSSDMEEARFGYIILTAEEYDTHVTNGRTTANEIFDTESALLRGTQVKTAPYTINLSELTEGSYYIVVAGVEAEDQIFRTVYHRISQAIGMEYSNETSENTIFTVVDNGNNTVTITPDNNTEYWYATFVPAGEVGEFDEESMEANLAGKLANAVINIFEESDIYVGEKILSTADLAEGDYKLVVGYILHIGGMFFPNDETLEYYDITVGEPTDPSEDTLFTVVDNGNNTVTVTPDNNTDYWYATFVPAGEVGEFDEESMIANLGGKLANAVFNLFEESDAYVGEKILSTAELAEGDYKLVVGYIEYDFMFYPGETFEYYDITVGNTTGISTATTTTTDAIYSITGQRMNKAQRGIMIQNGKKVLR
ncbi:MAG: hypothetical protein MJZ40_01420 [Bacteroidaceae bacterium]|nr:hypothetical protein [Bacteroidaceae bacterium]